MPDALTRLLRRFTPEAGPIDRDDLMYQAGRASAPSAARWKGLAALLALGQALTLLLLLARGGRPVAPASPSPVAPLTPTAAPVTGWTVRQKILDERGDLVPVSRATDLVPNDPPLRVYTAWTSGSLD